MRSLWHRTAALYGNGTVKIQQTKDQTRIGIRVSSLQKAARVQAWRAAGRALISGYVDAYTLLNFGVYASFMSGNTTSAGLHAGQAKLAAAGHSLLPIPFFVMGPLVRRHLFAKSPCLNTDSHSILWTLPR